MANQDIEFITNPIDYSGATLTEVIGEGKLFCYENHPAGDGYALIVGDGSTELQSLPAYTAVDEDTRNTQLCKIDAAAGAVNCGFVGVNVESTDTVRLYITFDYYPNQDAASISFTGTVSQNFNITDGGGTVCPSVDASSGVFSAPVVNGRHVYTEFTLAGAFSTLTTLNGGGFLVSSAGTKFVLGD